MPAFIERFGAFLLDAVAPPRAAQRLVRELGEDELRSLAQDGALPYHDPRVTALIWELKYRRSTRALSLAGAVLADALLDAAQDGIGVPLLIPVPMHPARRRARGHNQTELLCKAALIRLDTGLVHYAPGALSRERDTPPQQGLPKSARERNVRGSMRADAALVSRRRCIVLDDVSTTGATLSEAARALTEAGAASVERIALAKTD